MNSLVALVLVGALGVLHISSAQRTECKGIDLKAAENLTKTMESETTESVIFGCVGEISDKTAPRIPEDPVQRTNWEWTCKELGDCPDGSVKHIGCRPNPLDCKGKIETTRRGESNYKGNIFKMVWTTVNTCPDKCTGGTYSIATCKVPDGCEL